MQKLVAELEIVEAGSRIAGLVDLFSSPSEPGTNRSGVPDSIPTNFSVASLLI